MEYVDLFVFLLVTLFIFKGTIKIHRSIRSVSSLSMLLVFLLFGICGVIYISAMVLANYYYSPDNPPKYLTYLLASVGPATDLIAVLGSISYYSVSKTIKNKLIGVEENGVIML